MTSAVAMDDLQVMHAYHQRSKHRPQRFAAGPDTLDWDTQPDPFRRWAGAPLQLLPLVADSLTTPWNNLFEPGKVPARDVDISSIAALFELSFALTAWKHLGPDRWALRANPSSGNLHPTETWLISSGVPGLTEAPTDQRLLHHYAPREHGLELRCCGRAAGITSAVGNSLRADGSAGAIEPQLWVGLSSVPWREAWKYGERAFRYCQLDVGHALGALRYAAATLGWQARVVTGMGNAALASLLGLDRDADFGTSEREEAEVLVQIGPPDTMTWATPDYPEPWAAQALWQGQANRLDRHPMYRWPVIAEVAAATREPAKARTPAPEVKTPESTVVAAQTSTGPPAPLMASAGSAARDEQAAPSNEAVSPAATANEPRASQAAPLGHLPAAQLIRQRRSAQQFDRRASMQLASFMRLVAALLPKAGLPFDLWPHAPRVHTVLYAHRVDGLTPGAYVLPRSEAGARLLSEQLLSTNQPWQAVDVAPPGLPLRRIAAHPALAGSLRTLSCHQAIGSDACVAVSLLAEFDGAVDQAPWRYRELYHEAGLIGQVLYLQAEAEGLRGTGIGCYFDDAVHELLGIDGTRLQVLYHFTVGLPVADSRIESAPPYADRDARPGVDRGADAGTPA